MVHPHHSRRGYHPRPGAGWWWPRRPYWFNNPWPYTTNPIVVAPRDDPDIKKEDEGISPGTAVMVGAGIVGIGVLVGALIVSNSKRT